MSLFPCGQRADSSMSRWPRHCSQLTDQHRQSVVRAAADCPSGLSLVQLIGSYSVVTHALLLPRREDRPEPPRDLRIRLLGVARATRLSAHLGGRSIEE